MLYKKKISIRTVSKCQSDYFKILTFFQKVTFFYERMLTEDADPGQHRKKVGEEKITRKKRHKYNNNDDICLLFFLLFNLCWHAICSELGK
jgi:hypothetical protein